MKILMFGWELPPHISGGLGTACFGLTKGLASFSDIELTFVIPKAQGDEDQSSVKIIGASDVELSSEEINTMKKLKQNKNIVFGEVISAYISPERYAKLASERIATVNAIVQDTESVKLNFSGQYGTNLFEEISRYGVVAREIARNEKHDVIHAHDWLTFEAGIEAKRISGKPLVVHIHATEYDRCGMNHNKKVFKIEQTGMREADKVITVSNFTRNIVIDKYHIDPVKVITIHNAVEPVQTDRIRNLWNKTEKKDKIVTFLGRVTHQKGPEYFVNAAHSVLKRMNNVRFVMAGTGDIIEEMIRYVARLGISDKFHFTGFLQGEDVYKMYALSDLFIMPSVSEPFGISPLEALQSNVPVIISKQSGVSEVIKHAIKVDFWDVDAIADAVYAVLNYDALRNMLKKGKEEAENLKWSDTAMKIREVYYGLLYKSTG
jgi:glycosyltransferase involved in cell wall biosynthesis